MPRCCPPHRLWCRGNPEIYPRRNVRRQGETTCPEHSLLCYLVQHIFYLSPGRIQTYTMVHILVTSKDWTHGNQFPWRHTSIMVCLCNQLCDMMSIFYHRVWKLKRNRGLLMIIDCDVSEQLPGEFRHGISDLKERWKGLVSGHPGGRWCLGWCSTHSRSKRWVGWQRRRMSGFVGKPGLDREKFIYCPLIH